MMTMLKPALVPSLTWAALLAFAPSVQAQPAQIGRPAVSQHTDAGRQVIEIDMAALADPAPRRNARFASAAPSEAQPSAIATTRQFATPAPRKRFPQRKGVFEDAPMIALLGSTN